MTNNTNNLNRVLAASKDIAKEMKQPMVSSQHIFKAIMSLPDTPAYRFFIGIGLSQEVFETSSFDVAAKFSEELDASTVTSSEDIPYSTYVTQCLNKATDNAKTSGFVNVSVMHLLVHLIDSHYFKYICEEEKLSIGVLRTALTRIIQNDLDTTTLGKTTQASGKALYVPLKRNEYPNILSVGKDITDMAAKGELDKVIGREKEIDRAETILLRRTKNNPVFIGEPGSGKTALIEGIAQRIVDGTAPTALQNKHIVQLPLTNLVAGTKYRGEFEEKVRRLIEELEKSPNIILFIDELHTIIGAGAVEGSLDIANILKPALSRGTLQLIGATTSNEYKKYIEKDTALERRFQTILVTEPTNEETFEMLQGVKENFENHHSVIYTEDALKQAVELTKRYIPDRQLPDKAIDVLDEAGAYVAKSRTNQTMEKLTECTNTLATLAAEINHALRSKDFIKASKLHKEENRLNIERDTLLTKISDSSDDARQEVTVEDIASVVAKWSSIPVEKLTASESEKLLGLSKTLASVVIGQDAVSERIARTIQRSRTGIKNPNKPIGSFLFLGPTGVGKTEMARKLAEELFGSKDALIRLDMSEYMEKHSVSKLVGSPPGYVGYDEGGQLTEAVRKQPYSIILLDEAEKAHPDVFNILLQVLEEGRLTDSKGRTVDFKNTLILLTSNLGVSDLRFEGTVGFGSSQSKGATSMPHVEMEKKLKEKAKAALKPEFLNRLDDVLIFRALSADNLKIIAKQLIDKVAKHLATLDINIIVTDSVIDKVLEDGTNPEFGARPLSRAIESLLENYIAEELLKGKIVAGNTYQIDYTDNKVKHKKKPQKQAKAKATV